MTTRKGYSNVNLWQKTLFLYVSILYLTTLVGREYCVKMLNDWITVNNELERMWKEAFVT
jgi:hypothetical protein